MARTPPVFRPMTAEEIALARVLGVCTFPIGTSDKRFARDIRSASHAVEPRITDKQAALLRKLVTRYRRQIRPERLPESERHLLNPPKP